MRLYRAVCAWLEANAQQMGHKHEPDEPHPEGDVYAQAEHTQLHHRTRTPRRLPWHLHRLQRREQATWTHRVPAKPVHERNPVNTSVWGVITPNGIATVAPRGEHQARVWAAYAHASIGGIGETLARHDGTRWAAVE